MIIFDITFIKKNNVLIGENIGVAQKPIQETTIAAIKNLLRYNSKNNLSFIRLF